MKKILPALFLTFLFCQMVIGQTPERYGKPITEVFTDFHININDTSDHTGFNLNRAYFGYHVIPGGNISAKVIINIGSPEDIADGSVQRRYAFCREASLIWSDDKLTVSVGITGTKIFEFQQRFWGKRYVANTYQSINGYGFVADLGIAIDYRFNDFIKADLTLMNGEGYCNLQKDNNIRTSAGLTLTPNEVIAVRLYGDIQKQEGIWQPLFIIFAGLKNDLVTIGGEFTYKSNIDLNRGHHAWGFSATGGINLTEKTEVFCRYDFTSSVVTGNESLKWNFEKDGSFFVTGVQFTLSQYAKLALNYQGRYPYSSLGLRGDKVSLNAVFKF